jgi:rhomboid protease GluP
MKQNQEYEVVRATWLTQAPRPSSFTIAAISTSALLIGSALSWSDQNGLSDALSSSSELVFKSGEFWRLWSTLFVHADMGHLLSNCFLFFILGFFLYGHFGSLLFPLGALAAGGLVNAIALSTYAPEIRLIGASGVVYWMGGMWLVLYALLSRQKNLYHRWLRTIGVALLLFMPATETIAPNVSHRTHFFGFLIGSISAIPYYLLNRQRFLAAEIRELVIEDIESEDDPPETKAFSPEPPVEESPEIKPQITSQITSEKTTHQSLDRPSKNQSST